MPILRQAIRFLLRSPWYSGTVVSVIALGMALATTVFAVVDGVLFKPLPYERADELFRVTGGYQTGQRSGIAVAQRNLVDWAAAAPGVTIAAYGIGSGSAPPTGDLRMWAPSVARVDALFLDVLGVHPLIGGFQPADFDTEGDATPAIITYGLWQSMFGGRPDVIGQTTAPYESGGAGFRVVGVLPRDFLFPAPGRVQPNVLTPLIIPAASRDDLHYRTVNGIARLPRRLPLVDYQTRVDAAALAESRVWVPRPHEGSPAFDHAGLTPLETYLTGRQRPVFLIIFGTVAVLVLLACVNVSGLMASRVQDRARELAVRRALGAGSRQVAAMLLSESVIIVLVGTTVGLALAGPLVVLTLRLLPDAMGLLKPPSIDLRVIGFAVVTSAVAALVVSAWPVWRSLRSPAAYSMTNGSQATRRVRSTGRTVVVAAQVAMGLTLALGGALLVGSLVGVWQTDPGFRVDNLLVLRGIVAAGSTEARSHAIDAFLSDVGRVPGVAIASATQSPLLSGGSMMNAFADGATLAVMPGFLEATGLTLLEGRWLTPEEIASGAAVAVVSERVAKKVGKGGRVVDREIRGFVESGPRPFRVVGVVADAHFGSWDQEGSGEIYASYGLAATDQRSMTVVIRTGNRTRAVMTSLLPMVRNATGDVRVTSVATADDLLDESVRGRRLESWLFGSYAAAALAVVGVGVFGLMAMTTARRTREIGIRMAIGATRASVVRLLVREQLSAVVVGLGAGALVSSWAVTFVKSHLYQLTIYDIRVWSIAVALIVMTAALGIFVPSLRASRQDPIAALRVE